LLEILNLRTERGDKISCENFKNTLTDVRSFLNKFEKYKKNQKIYM